MRRHSLTSGGRLPLVGLVCALLQLCANAQAQDAAASGSEPQPQLNVGQDAGAPPAAASDTAAGPTIEMPAEMNAPSPDPTTSSWPQISLGVAPGSDYIDRGLMPQRMAQAGTVIGGYGQFNLTAVRPGNEDKFNARANVRRLVLFVSHAITDDIRVYTEFEWENAVSCSSCSGSSEVEQAFLQWRLHGDALMLRTGLILVPMGIVNQWHEPPVFHGVERPGVDQFIIPSTWRELGAGFAGTLSEMFRYELYLTTTLDPTKLSENGLAGGRTLGSLAPSSAFAVQGRAEIEPTLGVIAGVSFFLSDLGANGTYFNAKGKQRDLRLPLLGYAIDGRVRRWGFEARAVWAQFFFPNASDLVHAYHSDGSPLFIPEASIGTVPERMQGGYIEVAYDVFHPFHLPHELLAFVRLETYDTQAAVPTGYKRNPALDINEFTAGLTYRPLAQVVFKADFQLRDRRLGWDETEFDLGFGYMF